MLAGKIKINNIEYDFEDGLLFGGKPLPPKSQNQIVQFIINNEFGEHKIDGEIYKIAKIPTKYDGIDDDIQDLFLNETLSYFVYDKEDEIEKIITYNAFNKRIGKRFSRLSFYDDEPTLIDVWEYIPTELRAVYEKEKAELMETPLSADVCVPHIPIYPSKGDVKKQIVDDINRRRTWSSRKGDELLDKNNELLN